MNFAAGESVAGKYRLERVLGEGGMGTVWVATHNITRAPVAIKFLKPEYAKKLEIVHRFIREARAAVAVRHPNVVAIHDVLQLEDGTPAMVMDLLRGESLANKLSREHKLSAESTARLLVPAMSAVLAAHALGIVHRDLKPDNLFIASEGDGAAVKVLDFGIAKLTATEGDAASTGALTKTGSVLGTPYYMSPEQAFGEKDVDYKTDIWAFGIILYECLTGRRPTEGDNLGQIFKIIATEAIPPPRALEPSIPAEIDALVMQMLTKDRKARIASLLDVRDVLARYRGSSHSIPMPVARDWSEVATGPTIQSEPPKERALVPSTPSPAARTLSAVDIESRREPSTPASKPPFWIAVPAFLVVGAAVTGGALFLRARHNAELAGAPEAGVVMAPLAATNVLSESATSPASSASAPPSVSATPSAIASIVKSNAPTGPGHVAHVTAPTSATSATTSSPSSHPAANAAPSGRGPGGLVDHPTF